MRVILGRLNRTSADPAPTTVIPLIQDLFWAHARPSDGLEHVRARPAVHGLDVYLFVRAPSDASAVDQMRALLGRADQPLACYGFDIVLV